MAADKFGLPPVREEKAFIPQGSLAASLTFDAVKAFASRAVRDMGKAKVQSFFGGVRRPAFLPVPSVHRPIV